MTEAVKAAEICNNPDKFYNNNHESINKLIKHWKNFKKMDLYEFMNQYKDLIECQDTQRAFLGLNSPYVVEDEFQHMVGNFNIEFANFNPVEKQRLKLKDEFHNVTVAA